MVKEIQTPSSLELSNHLAATLRPRRPPNTPFKSSRTRPELVWNFSILTWILTYQESEFRSNPLRPCLYPGRPSLPLSPPVTAALNWPQTVKISRVSPGSPAISLTHPSYSPSLSKEIEVDTTDGRFRTTRAVFH